MLLYLHFSQSSTKLINNGKKNLAYLNNFMKRIFKFVEKCLQAFQAAAFLYAAVSVLSVRVCACSEINAAN